MQVIVHANIAEHVSIVFDTTPGERGKDKTADFNWDKTADFENETKPPISKMRQNRRF